VAASGCAGFAEVRELFAREASTVPATAGREAAPAAQDLTSRRAKTKAGVDEEQKRKNRTKVRVQAKVEWPFRVLKRVFGFTRVRYRGLKKNHEWLCEAFASINIYQHRRRLAKINLQMDPQGA
jgi:IS5 family transposase